MSGPHDVTKQFEAELCRYTGAPFAVAVNSCTMALLLAVRWALQTDPSTFRKLQFTGKGTLNGERWPPAIEIPRRTYVSVPQAIIHAGGRPTFRDEDWAGAYQLRPLPVWDCARRFRADMYRYSDCWDDSDTGAPHGYVCVSFHASKILGDTQGGAILHDNPEADAWFRRARFDGRAEGVAPKDDTWIILGWHCYLSPDVAARLLMKLYALPAHNYDLPNDDYPDLSKLECFR